MQILDKIRDRNLLAISLAIFVDTLLYGIIVPVVPRYATDLGASEAQLGFIFAIYSLALLLANIPFGLLSDRQGPRRLMILGMFGLAVVTLLFSLAGNAATLAVSRALQGVAAAATWTAGLALLAAIYPREQRGEKMGLAMAVAGAGSLAGPVLGGALFQWGGYRLPFWVAGSLALAAGFLALTIPVTAGWKASAADLEKESAGWRQIWTGWLGDPSLQAGTLAVLVSTIGLGMMEPLLPVHLDRRFGAGEGVIGLIFGASTLSYIIVQPWVGRWSDRWGREPLILTGLASTALFFPFMGWMPGLWLEGVVIVMLGITYSLLMTPLLPLLADSVGDPAGEGGAPYGLAFGIFNTFYSLGYLLGPVMGGVGAGLWGLPLTFAMYSFLLTGTISLFICSRRKSRQVPDYAPNKDTCPPRQLSN